MLFVRYPLIYRSKYLPKNTVAVVKEEKKEMYSKESITWLSQFPSVQHALNGGEVTICGSPVDGFDKESNTIYQYHGCFWHGHPKCTNPDTINTVNNETMDDLYEKTTRRIQQLRDAGYKVVEMWECEWAPKEASFFDFTDPLKPRDGFYGGRTDSSKLKVENHKLHYIDVVSLYPTVQYYDPYPVGHPVKIFKPKSYDPNWFGLIKCTVLPPRKLYHPVLPVRTDKLTFTLCRTCMELEISLCTHTEDERSLSGTWTTLELNKALEKGYKVVKIDEVWHFREQTTDLFKGYIDDFMKIKLQTSPHNYETNEAYALAIKRQMGLDLDIDKIEPNPGMRAIAKICLNSLWGKFGQRQNMCQTEYITDLRRWYDILLDDKLTIASCLFLTDEMVQVTYKYKDLFYEDSTSTNIYIASFTTANARLRLYEMLDRLGDSVAYSDTDSVVYIDNGLNAIPTGSMLGEWSSELDTDDYICEWLSTGPKSYYYKTVKGVRVTKIKGFTLNYENGGILNSESMNSIIEYSTDKVELRFDQITRNVNTKNIETKKTCE